MTAEERVTAIAEFGFTERQARFLVLVMRHAGVCVPRQYATFAGVANGGEKSNALFDKLIEQGCAVACSCRHNRARVYHIHHKPLYRAIGEPESRHRRPVSARRAVERLMLLDAVLASPDFDWLTTEREKAAYLAGLMTPEAPGHSPALTSGSPSRAAGAFPATFPIGLDAGGRALVLYLATVPRTDDFRVFLQGTAAFLTVVPSWTLRLVFPRPLDRVYTAYQTVVREELETPLHRATIGELQWYFEHRQKAVGQSVHPVTQGFLDRAAKVFNTPRFTLLYRRWLRHGEAAFQAVSSPVFADALASGTGRVECDVLSQTYRHLSPLGKVPRSPQPIPQQVSRSARPDRPTCCMVTTG